MNTRTLAIAIAALMLALPTALVIMPAGAHEEEPEPVTPQQLADRFTPRAPGVEREMTFFYGPFTIPPGQDINRVTADVPVQGGFLTDVQANLYDVETGARPSNQDMHIHHAHWFRTSEDPNDAYYVSDPSENVGIAWVFGTGEERTRGNLNGRTAAESQDISYGIFVEPGQPQALIYMLHNKNAVTRHIYVALDVTFVYGSADEIAAADDCGLLPLQEGEVCRAGEDFHHLHGTLWGNTFDVPRNFDAWNLGQPSTYIRGPSIVAVAERPVAEYYGASSSMAFEAPTDGVSIGTAGHLHPNGREVRIANLGSEAQPCGDLDNDGFPGITIARSVKIEQVAGAFPYSEEFQMGATKDAWRAPVREGDRIVQFGIYSNDRYASYEAMSFAGIYVDRQQEVAPRGTAGCTMENTAAYLLDAPAATWSEVTETTINDDWDGRVSHGHCGLAADDLSTDHDDESRPCHDASKPVPSIGTGKPAPENTVHIANFLNIPGDQSLSGDLGAPVAVTKGDVLRFVNEDVAIGVRHTITSCEMPCNGQYVANYPQPDGHFDSDKMANLDYIDGGLADPSGDHSVARIEGTEYSGPGIDDAAYPHWDLETADLDAGLYSYYCRIHPWMRGWVEVVEPTA